MSAWTTPRGQLTRVGPWQLGDTLGRGAYAHVRRATNTLTGREVACKILPALHACPGPKSWDDTLDAIEAHKEVVILKALSGANIPGVVGLEGVLQEDGWTYVFLTLHKSVLGGPYDPRGKNLIHFFRKLLRVVQALHEIGISHEDLKRSNVLLSFDDDGMGPALADFGFSQFFPRGGKVRSLGGTFDYSSPEKVADERYDPCANDVWALGILLVKMLNIRHPYISKTDDSKAARKRILTHPPLWSWTDADLRSGRADLIMGMLDRDPVARSTITQTLAHPFLQDADDQLDPIKVPSARLSSKVPRPVDSDVVQDVAFMAYLTKTHHLCETPKLICKRLAGREECWEKRWATMLSGWQRSRDLHWEDLPSFPYTGVTNPPRLLKTIKPLKPIYLSPITGMPLPGESNLAAVDIFQALAPPASHDTHCTPPKAGTLPVRKPRMNAMKTKAQSGSKSTSPASIDTKPARLAAAGTLKTRYDAFDLQKIQNPIHAPSISTTDSVGASSSGSSTAVSLGQDDVMKDRVPLGARKTVRSAQHHKTRLPPQKARKRSQEKPSIPQINLPFEELALNAQD